MSTPPQPRSARGGCPLCGKPASGAQRPFCGQGCRDRDLLQWLGEGYRVAGPPAQESEADRLDSGG
ncbi:MAG: DNA gyrase inhibitor YacG [Alphaproteobacteria bacterium]|nr:DNA gyrase inhibitor YacG [Alphaproteobacteria bacterium]